MTRSLEDCLEIIYKAHDIDANQKYAKEHPYSFHLKRVVDEGHKFTNVIIPIAEKELKQQYILLPSEVHVALAAHDICEDARWTYNDVKQEFGVIVAEIVYLCTENKGRNRSERKDHSFYNELKTNKLAVFVKLCDLIANVKYSLLTNSTMFDKYKSEYTYKIKPHLFTQEFKPMFDYLDKIFEIQ